ncbi:MAG: glycosyltransferase family 2 protein [Sedimentisphaerales bacterium]|nr:glycosyltransferase family 2 protein [Sedimentisphaerales bacterium]
MTLIENLCVVIPAKNEAQSIAEIITGCRQYTNNIIVSDGNSKDKTREIAEKLNAKVIIDPGKGKGSGIRASIKHITDADIVVFIDADGSHDPNDIPKLIEPIQDGTADHVTGSRLLGGSSELHGGFDEFMRLTGSSFIAFCINHRFKLRLSDSQNGFRAIRGAVLKALDLKENITTIEQEMIIKTLKKNYRMAEVPTHEYKRKYGQSNIQMRKVFFRYVYSLIKYLYF